MWEVFFDQQIQTGSEQLRPKRLIFNNNSLNLNGDYKKNIKL